MERFELAGITIEMIRGNAVAFFIIAINDWQPGMKRQVPRLEPGGRAGSKRIVFRKFA